MVRLRHFGPGFWFTELFFGYIVFVACRQFVIERAEFMGNAPRLFIGLAVLAFPATVMVRLPLQGLDFTENLLKGRSTFRTISVTREEIAGVSIEPAFNVAPTYRLRIDRVDGSVTRLALYGKHGWKSGAEAVARLVERWKEGGMEALPRVVN